MKSDKRQPADQDDRWHRALARARLGVWDVDLTSGRTVYSSTWKHMLGYGDDELPDDEDLWLRFVHPDDREHAIACGERHIAGLVDDINSEFRMRHKDGHWIWINDRGGIVERAEDGTPLRMLGVQADVSRQKQAESDLDKLNERHRLALDASGVGIWQFEPATETLFWDQRMREIFGIGPGPSAVPRGMWHEHLHPDDKGSIEDATDRGMGSPDVLKLTYRIVRPDGEIRHIESLSKFVTDSKYGDRLVGVTRDITEQVEAAEALAHEKERLRVTLQSISDAVLSTDTEGFVDFANASAVSLLDRSEDELIGRDIREILNFGETQCLCEPEARDPRQWDGDCCNRLWEFSDLGTQERAVRCTSSPIIGPGGAWLGMVFTLQDVTDENARQRELAFAARHDALTGALNRAAFDLELDRHVTAAPRTPFALFYVDLDHFKALNDFAGHAAGDAALIAVTQAIRSALPAGGVVARLGGDEFAALAPANDMAAAEKTGRTLCEVIAAASRRSVPDGNVSASVGIQFVNDDSLPGTDILALADDACYAAKSGGRNRFVLNGGTNVRGLTAIKMVSDIADAMEDGRLRLFGQEIRSLDQPWEPTRRVEILSRLTDRAGNAIPPCEFIPAAERFGMAPTLDRWTLQTVLERYGAHMKGPDGFTFGFNLSAQTLSDGDLWSFVARLLRDTGADPDHIVFEITETTAVTNFEAAEAFVREARRTGCRVSLDDFGAGLSSFAYLRRFPIDTLKVDGSFVSNIASNRFDRAIVTCISGMARDLGFKVVAEKIEEERSIPILREIGVDLGQGFLMHRPEPIENIVGGDANGSRARAI